MRTLVNMNEISDFSQRFSAALQGVMRENKVTVAAVAHLMGKSKGFVSTHTSGKAAPDTDLIDAVAALSKVPTRELITEVARRMRNADVHAVGSGSAPVHEVKQGDLYDVQADFVLSDGTVIQVKGEDALSLNPANANPILLEGVVASYYARLLKYPTEAPEVDIAPQMPDTVEELLEMAKAADEQEQKVVRVAIGGLGSVGRGALKPHPSDIDEDAIAADDQDREKDTMK